MSNLHRLDKPVLVNPSEEAVGNDDGGFLGIEGRGSQRLGMAPVEDLRLLHFRSGNPRVQPHLHVDDFRSMGQDAVMVERTVETEAAHVIADLEVGMARKMAVWIRW